MATYTGKETLYEYMKEDIPDGNHTFVLEANGEKCFYKCRSIQLLYQCELIPKQDSLGSANADR